MSDTGEPERRRPGTHWPEALPDPDDVEPETDEGVLRDGAEARPRPVHDHRFGGCDLPPRPTPEGTDTRCRWERPEAHIFGHTCCSGCHDRVCVA